MSMKYDDLSYITLIANSYVNRYGKFLVTTYGTTYKTNAYTLQSSYFTKMISTISNDLGNQTTFDNAVKIFRSDSLANQDNTKFSDEDLAVIVDYGINYVTTFSSEVISVTSSAYDRYVAQMKSYLSQIYLNLTDDEITTITNLFANNISRLGEGSSIISDLQSAFEKSLEDMNDDPNNTIKLNREKLDDIEVESNTLMIDMISQYFYNMYMQHLTKFNASAINDMFDVSTPVQVIDNNILKTVVYNMDMYERKKIKTNDVVILDDATLGVILDNGKALDDSGNEVTPPDDPPKLPDKEIDTKKYSEVKAEVVEQLNDLKIYLSRSLKYTLTFKRGISGYTLSTDPTIVRCSFKTKDIIVIKEHTPAYGYTTAYNIRGTEKLPAEEGVIYKYVEIDEDGNEKLNGYYEYNRYGRAAYTKIWNTELALGPFSSDRYRINESIDSKPDYQNGGVTYIGELAADNFIKHPTVNQPDYDPEVDTEGRVVDFNDRSISLYIADNTINTVKDVTISHDKTYATDVSGHVLSGSELNANTIYQDNVSMYDATDRYFRYSSSTDSLVKFNYETPISCAMYTDAVSIGKCVSVEMDEAKDVFGNYINPNEYPVVTMPAIIDGTVSSDMKSATTSDGRVIEPSRWYQLFIKEYGTDKVKYYKWNGTSFEEKELDSIKYYKYTEEFNSEELIYEAIWEEVPESDVPSLTASVTRPYVMNPEKIPGTSKFNDNMTECYDINDNVIPVFEGNYVRTPLTTEVVFRDNDYSVAYTLDGVEILAEYGDYRGFVYTNDKGKKTYFNVPTADSRVFIEYEEPISYTYYRYTPITEGSYDCEFVPKDPWYDSDEHEVYYDEIDYGDSDNLLYRWIAPENTDDGIGYYSPFDPNYVVEAFLANDEKTPHEGYELAFNPIDCSPIMPETLATYTMVSSLPKKENHLYYHWVPYFGQYQPLGPSLDAAGGAVVDGFIDKTLTRYVKSNGKELDPASYSTFKLYTNGDYDHDRVGNANSYWIWTTVEIPDEDELKGTDWDEWFNDKSNYEYRKVLISYTVDEKDNGPIRVTLNSDKTIATGKTDEAKYKQDASDSIHEKMLTHIFYTGSRDADKKDRTYYYWNVQEKKFKRIYIAEGKRKKCMMLQATNSSGTKLTTTAYVAISKDRSIITPKVGKVYASVIKSYDKSEKALMYFWNRTPVTRIGVMSSDMKFAEPESVMIDHVTKDRKFAYSINGDLVAPPNPADGYRKFYSIKNDAGDIIPDKDKQFIYHYDRTTGLWCKATDEEKNYVYDAKDELVAESSIYDGVGYDYNGIQKAKSIFCLDKSVPIYFVSANSKTAYYDYDFVLDSTTNKYKAEPKAVENPVHNQLYTSITLNKIWRYRQYFEIVGQGTSGSFLVVDNDYLSDNELKFKESTMVMLNDAIRYMDPNITTTVGVGMYVKLETTGQYFLFDDKLDTIQTEYKEYYEWDSSLKKFVKSDKAKEGQFTQVYGYNETSIDSNAIANVYVMTSPNRTASGEYDEYYAFINTASGPTMIEPDDRKIYYDNIDEIVSIVGDTGKNFVWDTVSFSRVDVDKTIEANVNTDNYLTATNADGILIPPTPKNILENSLSGGGSKKYYIYDPGETTNSGFIEYNYMSDETCIDININDHSFNTASLVTDESTANINLYNPNRIFYSTYNTGLYYKYKLDAIEAWFITEGLTYGLYPNGVYIPVDNSDVSKRKIYYIPLWEECSSTDVDAYLVVGETKFESSSFNVETMRCRTHMILKNGGQPDAGVWCKQVGVAAAYKWNGYKFTSAGDITSAFRYVQFVPEKADPILVSYVSNDRTKAYDEEGAIITPKLYDLYIDNESTLWVYDDGHVDTETRIPISRMEADLSKAYDINGNLITPNELYVYDNPNTNNTYYWSGTSYVLILKQYISLDAFAQEVDSDGFISAYDKEGEELTTYGYIIRRSTNGFESRIAVIYKDAISDGTSGLTYKWDVANKKFVVTNHTVDADTVNIDFTVTYIPRSKTDPKYGHFNLITEEY